MQHWVRYKHTISNLHKHPQGQDTLCSLSSPQVFQVGLVVVAPVFP